MTYEIIAGACLSLFKNSILYVYNYVLIYMKFNEQQNYQYVSQSQSLFPFIPQQSYTWYILYTNIKTTKVHQKMIQYKKMQINWSTFHCSVHVQAFHFLMHVKYTEPKIHVCITGNTNVLYIHVYSEARQLQSVYE